MLEKIELDSAIFKGAPRVNMSRRGIIMGLAAGSVFPFISSCTTNPETGRNQLVLVSDQQIAGMASAAWTDMKSQTRQTSDTRLKGRVLNIWDKIATGANRGDQQWDVAVFDTDDVNAFVMPGNKVGVYRGITELTENDDQLSSVLGHEVGHVVGRHAAERMSIGMVAQASMIAGQIAIAQSDELRKYGNQIAALGGAAIQFGVILPYSRAHESEADKLGVGFMHNAGFDVRQAPRLWELMDANSKGKRPPEFMSTHPAPARRAADLKAYINRQGWAIM